MSVNIYAVNDKELLFFDSILDVSKYFKCSPTRINGLIKRHQEIMGYRLLNEEMAGIYTMPKPNKDITVRDIIDDDGYDLVHYTKPNCFVWYGKFSKINTDPLDSRLNRKVLKVYENKTENGIRRVIVI